MGSAPSVKIEPFGLALIAAELILLSRLAGFYCLFSAYTHIESARERHRQANLESTLELHYTRRRQQWYSHRVVYFPPTYIDIKRA